MAGSPGAGKGSRNLDCDLYEDCLDQVVKKDWDGFHCEDCTYEADQASGRDAGVTGKAKALCSDCLERPTLGSSPYCAKCLGVRGNRAKAAKAAKAKDTGAEKPKKAAKAKNKGTEKPKKAKETQDKPKGKKVLNDANTALTITIDFGKHPLIIREVERLAEDQIRPVVFQIIYMLKAHLNRIAEEEARKATIPTP